MPFLGALERSTARSARGMATVFYATATGYDFSRALQGARKIVACRCRISLSFGSYAISRAERAVERSSALKEGNQMIPLKDKQDP